MLTEERDRLRATAKIESAADGRKKCCNDDNALHGLNNFSFERTGGLAYAADNFLEACRARGSFGKKFASISRLSRRLTASRPAT